MSRSNTDAGSTPGALWPVPNHPNAGYGRDDRREGKVATQPPASSSAASSRPRVNLDLSAFARHQLWLARPTAHVVVDHEQNRLIVSFYPGSPDREIDPTEALSTAFHGPDGDVLLTSLCLLGPGRWSLDPVHDDVWAARELLGPTVRDAVDELLAATPVRGTMTGAELSLAPGEAESLAQTWLEFVRRHEARHRPAGA